MSSARDRLHGARWPCEMRPYKGCAQPSPRHTSLSDYKSHVAFVAKRRPPNSKHWRRVQDYAVKALKSAGLAVERSKYATGIDIIATLTGIHRPSEEVWLSAHYDSCRVSPNADDNASGVAAVLSLAAALGRSRPERTLKMALWDKEKRGMIGSSAHTRQLAVRETHVVASIVSRSPSPHRCVAAITPRPGTQTMVVVTLTRGRPRRHQRNCRARLERKHAPLGKIFE